LERAIERFIQNLNTDRFADVGQKSRFLTPLYVLFGNKTCDGDALQAQAPEFSHEFISVPIGETDIGNDQIVSVAGSQIPRVLHAFGSVRFIAAIAQERQERKAGEQMILDHQDPFAHAGFVDRGCGWLGTGARVNATCFGPVIVPITTGITGFGLRVHDDFQGQIR
jgi:hypothetical protein